MTPNVYLRRAPRGTSRRGLVVRWLAALVVLLAFAMIDTAASVHYTRLTRDIQRAKSRIEVLTSERSFLVRQMGRREGQAVDLAHVDPSFATPDSGRVRLLTMAEATWQ